MKLYVANCSKQECHFTYMIPENPRPFSHHIRAGGQIQIDGNQPTIDAIVNQHAIDKPISVEAIESGFTQSDQEMIDRAQQARNATAAAADQILQNKAQEMGLKQKSGLEVEIVEDKKNAADNGEKFNQTIEVVREGVQPLKGRGRPRK